MLEIFTFTFSSMLVIFTYILAGFILNKKKILPEGSDRVISKLENNLLIPALVLSTFSTQCTINSLKENYTFIIYSLITFLAAFLISLFVSRFFAPKGTYRNCIYRYSFVFANFGFVGNALIPLLFPENASEMLYKYMLFTLPLQIAAYTWGISTLIPQKSGKMSFLSRLNNPTFYAIAIGIILGITDSVSLIPSFISQCLSLLGSCMAPLAMILTGFVIGGYPFCELFKEKKIYLAVFLRLFIIPTVILAVLYFLNSSQFIMTLALFAYATPMGMNTVIFPAAYGGETKTGAAMLLISSLLCLFSIPIMYSLFTLIVK